MADNAFKTLKLDPFKEYSSAEIDTLVKNKEEELKRLISRSENVGDRAKYQATLADLPNLRKAVSNVQEKEAARNEVLSILTNNLEDFVFYTQAGDALLFEDKLEKIIEPATNRGWTLQTSAVREIPGYKIVKKSDYKSTADNTAFGNRKLMGELGVVEWTNQAIGALYTQDGIPADVNKVTDATPYKTFNTLISTLSKRAQGLQKNKNFPRAEETKVILDKIKSSFKDEASFMALKKVCILYDVEIQLRSDAASGKPIDYKTIVGYINKYLAGKGVSTDETVNELEKFCLSSGIVADFSVGRNKEYTSCGYCGCRFILQAGGERCPFCAKPLFNTCPQCQTKNASTNKTCIKCAFSFEVLQSLPTQEKAIREEIDHGNPDWVKIALVKLKGYETFCDQNLLKEAQMFVDSTDKLRENLKNLEVSKQYNAALTACKTYLRTYPKAGEILLKKEFYEQQIQKVDQKIRALGNSPNRNAEYVALTEICSDHPKLLEHFETNRPDAPTNLEVKESSEGNIILNFSAPESSDYTFLIIRKEGSSPTSENDGKTIAVINSHTYTDRDFSYGTEYFYAVFSKRWGVLSRAFAKTKGITVFAEVKNPTASPAEEGIAISYEIPRGCTKVYISRAEGEMPDPDDKERIDNGLRPEYVDRKANNGSVVYHYLIIAEYSEGRSKAVRSKGVEVFCRPEALPDPILDMSIEKRVGTFIARWTKVEYQTDLRMADTDLNIEGSTCSVDDLDRRMPMIPNTVKNRDGSVSFELAPNQLKYVYPVITVGHTALVGNCVVVSSLRDISALRVTMDGSKCHLIFQWPQKCNQIKIAIRDDRYPNNPEDNTKSYDVPLEEYNANGSATIDIPYANTYIKIYSIYDKGQFSGGFAYRLNARGELPRIKYKITPPSFMKKDFTVKFTFDAGMVFLPAMVIRGSDDFMPKRSTGGIDLLRIPKTNVNSTSFTVTFPKGKMTKKIKVYFQNIDDDRVYQLIPEQ